MDDVADRVLGFQTVCAREALMFIDRAVSLQDAVDYCQRWAEGRGLVDSIGQDEVQLIMVREFARVRKDLDGWVP